MTPRSLRDPSVSIRRLNRTALGIVVLLVGGVGGWAATSELSGAVIAGGVLAVETSVREVQHPDGGIVGEMLVAEGEEVEAGQVLVRLDATAARSRLGIVRSALDAEIMRRERLLAERDGTAELSWPAILVDRRDEPVVAQSYAGEAKLIAARRGRLEGERARLAEKIAQLEAEIRGLEAQASGKAEELVVVERDFETVGGLYQRNLVPLDRHSTLAREKARLKGEGGRLAAEIARTKEEISETGIALLQLDRDFAAEVLKDLRETEETIAELSERAVAAEDELRRIEIRAPRAGTVHNLAIHGTGAVVQGGKTILSIVPTADRLVADLKVRPTDIDQIAVGAPVRLRILAANQRTNSLIDATLVRVSAEQMRDTAEGHGYYLARAEFPAAAAPGDGLRLVSGMPVEAYVTTGTRTPLQFLWQPIGEQLDRAFRER